MLQRFRKRPNQYIVALRLDLDTDGFDYRKWGGIQHCKAGDWLVNNGGDVYTVDAESFAKTYRAVANGYYVKTAPVWAEVASEAGSVETKEGESHYQAGDYLVSNSEDGSDRYCIDAAKFNEMYEIDR